ncbi:MAG: bacterial Ig-like domain-containing protein [Clostridium sp.]|nr:MAG: bacterial Ig-like domain-containing protein [Clostridium sp.]
MKQKNLFTITDDGKNVVVRASMIDESKFNRSEVGEYEVTLNYKGKAVTATVNVVANKKVTASVNSDMLICHKGDESYDVKEAFSVYAGDKKLTITDEMLSGSVDYNRTGIYDIKLTYDYYGELTIVDAKI